MCKKSNTIAQRAGALIEKYICNEYGLFWNQKQQTHGHYDAYDMKYLYEIKAVSTKTDRCTINLENHNKLLTCNGKYIVVYYEYEDKDKRLQIITDVIIKNIILISSRGMNILIDKYGTSYDRKHKYNTKTYCRVKSEYVISHGKKILPGERL